MAKNMIQVDINAESIPPAVKDLQPKFYKEDGDFLVVDADFTGMGPTLAAAMDDFQQKYEAEKENSL